MAQGKFGGGAGVVNSPYLIEDAEDLHAIRFLPNAYYKLANSINLGVAPYNTELGWLPIKDFTGVLDGNGKKIYNLFINRQSWDYVGLFETLDQMDGKNYSCVYDLGIENADVTGRQYVGMLAGAFRIYRTSAAAGVIVNRCYFTGKVSAGTYGGGAFGYVTWDTNAAASAVYPLAKDCFFDVTFQPNTLSNYFGNIAGGISNSAARNFTLDTILSASRFVAEINGKPAPTLNPQVHGAATVAWNSAVECYHDNERWLFNALSSTGISTKDMMSTRFSPLENRMNGGVMIWDFTEGRRYPMLRQFFMDRFFVRTNAGYCVYENGAWVMKYTKMPTRAQAVETGMRTLDDIPRTAWDVLKASNASVDVVNVLELSKGATERSVSLPMERDTALSTESRNYFRKEIAFEDFGHNIVTVHKGGTV